MREIAIILGCASFVACASVEPRPPLAFRVDKVTKARAARVDVRYVELGDASAIDAAKIPVVYLHPWGADLDIWLDVAPALAAERRTVLIDLPGHGGSGQPPGRYPPRRLAQSVVAVLDDAGIDRAILVGNSIGGGVAMAVSDLAPDRVVGLVLVGAPLGAEIPEIMRKMAGAAVSPRALATVSPAVLRALWGVAAGHDNPSLLRLADRAVAERESPAWPARAAAQCSALREVILYAPSVEKIRVPTLVVQGADDRVVWPSTGRALAERIPGARLVMLEGCGHFPEVDCPQRFTPPLREFLDQVDRAR